jgi:hypothetical protein
MRHIKLAAIALFAVSYAFGQATDGNLIGTVLDPSGAAVSAASVTVQNNDTGAKATAKTDSTGTYRLDHLLVGTYNITAGAAGFTTTTLNGVQIELNKNTTVNVKLQVGNVSTVVEISETAASIDTTTSQVANTFTSQMASELPSTANPNGGVLNLSLLGAGVSSNGGVGVGTGPSVGGQRPRNNSFNIEGVDNNRKDVTGAVVSVPNDSVAEFSLLQNQFSAEYGHSSGGQFNTVLVSGTNQIHGKIWEYLENRNLNAIDQSFARQFTGTLPPAPRYDNNRLGAMLAGKIIKNKLFYMGSYEYVPLGQASVSSPVYSPTAAGYATLAGISTLNATNFGILKQYAAPAPVQGVGAKGSINVCTANLPTTAISGVGPCPASSLVPVAIGILPVVAPNFSNTYRYLISGDYNISEKDQLRARYVDNKVASIRTAAQLPIFFTPRPTTSHLASVSEFHSFTPGLNNELRLAYNRYNDNITVPDFPYPGLDVFPNVVANDLNQLNIGPDPNGPQATIQSTYQLVENMSWTKGRHEIKFGFDGRDLDCGEHVHPAEPRRLRIHDSQ